MRFRFQRREQLWLGEREAGGGGGCKFTRTEGRRRRALISLCEGVIRAATTTGKHRPFAIEARTRSSSLAESTPRHGGRAIKGRICGAGEKAEAEVGDRQGGGGMPVARMRRETAKSRRVGRQETFETGCRRVTLTGS